MVITDVCLAQGRDEKKNVDDAPQKSKTEHPTSFGKVIGRGRKFFVMTFRSSNSTVLYSSS